MSQYTLSHLAQLEAESIHIMREVVAEFENPLMLYSIGKDSSVMLRLAQKAFHPGKIPFPLLHIDTGWKFKEMYEFRERMAKEIGFKLLVHKNDKAAKEFADPTALSTEKYTNLFKTEALVEALTNGKYDAAFGGARRDEEQSRAKERIFSFRDKHQQWDPKNQRPELWNLYNTKLNPGESIRVFPLSNWTELDVWNYILAEEIPVVPLYFAAVREVYQRGQELYLAEAPLKLEKGEKPKKVLCRFRSLGCSHVTGAVESKADSIEKIIAELESTKLSERASRAIDHDVAHSMEKKKQRGYF